ncbi:MAG: hypothetical protein WCG25_05370 [bacterium]
MELEMIDRSTIDSSLLLDNKANEKFDIIGSIMIENDLFKPAKDFNNLDFVKQ